MRQVFIALASFVLALSAAAQGPNPCGVPGVTVTVTPPVAVAGQPITVTLTNNSPQTIDLPSSCTFTSIFANSSCSGSPVFAPICLQVITPVPSGTSRSQTWNQQDNGGQQVPNGTYAVRVFYFDGATGASFSCCTTFEIGVTGTSGCTGDGGDQMGCTDCPCGNNAPVGCPGGCQHSASAALFGGCGAELRASGSPRASDMTLCFDLTTAKPNSFAILASGTMVTPANPANPCFAQNPGSGVTSASLDGLRCVAIGVLRHGARPIDATGNTANPWGYCSASFPNSSFFVGGPRHFQAFYREEPGLVCGTGQNTSQRVTIVLTP